MHSAAHGWTKLSFNLGVSKILLGKAGLVDVSKETKGVYKLTDQGKTVREAEVPRLVQDARLTRKSTSTAVASDEDLQPEPRWKLDLLETLQSIPPAAFERLAELLLRKAGFVKVEVTGKSSDGGIDGLGVLRVQELLSFHVYFQCKRYKGTVSSPEIRNFRGAISGRSDKGLFITTGSFTSEAKKEATRDGVPPIDLIDGDRLCELLKGLELGVKSRKVEEITTDLDWFSQL